MKVAFLCTEYPLVTHTFIRREIHGVEKCGIGVVRVAIRKPASHELPDSVDQVELERTFGILERGAWILLDVAMVACLRPGAWVSTALRAAGFGWRSKRGLLGHLGYFAEACVLWRVLRREQAKHVHAHFGDNATMVALLAKYLGGPGYSFQVHGPGEFDAPEFIHLSEKVAEARFVTAISDYARGQVLRWSAPQFWSKVHIVRCGVDKTFLRESDQEFPVAARLVSIGRLSRSKAIPMLIDAVDQLMQEGRVFEVILIGVGELRESLERAIAQRGIEHTLKMVGAKNGEEIRNELLKSRALVLPSVGEGLPVVIMEALAVSRPVIATQIAGIPELVVHKRNGWLIPAGNLSCLVDAMREALDMAPAKLRDMGTYGRQAVHEKHDSEREAAKLADLFQRLEEPGTEGT